MGEWIRFPSWIGELFEFGLPFFHISPEPMDACSLKIGDHLVDGL